MECQDKSVRLGKKLLAEVLCEDAGNGIEQAREHGKPGGLKVQRAAPARGPAKHGRKRKIEQGGSADASRFTPVKMRMRQDNAEAADHQSEKAERENPVSDADQRRVAGRIQNF